LLGFALLAAAVTLHLRERGPSVEALHAAGDVESLLSLLHIDSTTHGQRAREALLTLLPELTREQKVEDIVAALRGDDSEIRQRAAEELASLNAPAATRALANAVRDYTERLPDDLRVRMLEWLAVRDDAETTEVLLDGLHDRSAMIREVSYAQLYARVQFLRERRDTVQLARIMRRGDPDLRGAAIAALGQLGLPEATGPLSELAGDYSAPPETRCLAVRALRSTPGDDARAALHERLADFFPAVRQCASEALSRPAPATAEDLDGIREQAAERLHAALAAHLEGRRTTTPEGESFRWEDEALGLGQRLHEAAGRDLVYAVFHEVDRRLRASHGRSPRMLRLLWQQQSLL
jgi:HEAT repeat protein